MKRRSFIGGLVGLVCLPFGLRWRDEAKPDDVLVRRKAMLDKAMVQYKRKCDLPGCWVKSRPKDKELEEVIVRDFRRIAYGDPNVVEIAVRKTSKEGVTTVSFWRYFKK